MRKNWIEVSLEKLVDAYAKQIYENATVEAIYSSGKTDLKEVFAVKIAVIEENDGI